MSFPQIPDANLIAKVFNNENSHVAKNGWWNDVCPIHGLTPHHSYLGGACEKCHKEGRAK